MRILYINSAGFYEGGVEDGFRFEAEWFRAAGHDLRFLTSDFGERDDRFSDYEFRSVSGRFKRFSLAYSRAARACLRTAIADFAPDLVVVNTMTAVTPSVLFELTDTPTILMVHGPEWFTKKICLWSLPGSDFRSPQHRWSTMRLSGWLKMGYVLGAWRPVFALGARNIDRVVVMSSYLRSILEQQGLNADYLPMAVNLPPVADDPAPAPIFVFAGRLEAIKGVQFVLPAVRRLIDAERAVTFEIAGDGSYREELENLAGELGLDDAVTFHGHLSKDELRGLLARAFALIMPSVWPEPFGKSGVEALGAGLPVIATDAGGVRDWLVPGVNGLLVAPASVDDLTEAMTTLLEDPELRGSLRAQARPSVEKFDYPQRMPQLLAKYHQVVDDVRTG